jgi:hypothetical protein
MIIGCIGDRGSGKTLFMTYEAYNHYRNGKKVWSNYHLKFPKLPNTTPPQLIPNDFFINFEKYNLKDVAMFIDEFYVYIDSRSSQSNVNKVMSYFLNQTRKTHVDLYYSSQFFSQVDKRLRFNTERFIIPKCFVKNGKKYILIEVCNRDLKLLKKFVLIAEAIYPFYETDEIIKFNKTS